MTVWKSHCRGPYPPFLNGGERRQHRKTGRNPVGGCVRKYGRGGDCGCRSFTLVEPRSRPHFDGRLYSCSREAGSPIVPNHRSNCHPGQQRAAALALALVPPRAMRRKTTMMMGWMCCKWSVCTTCFKRCNVNRCRKQKRFCDNESRNNSAIWMTPPLNGCCKNMHPAYCPIRVLQCPRRYMSNGAKSKIVAVVLRTTPRRRTTKRRKNKKCRTQMGESRHRRTMKVGTTSLVRR